MSEENTCPPILITGAARSGTSLTAGIVNQCGAFGGIMRAPNEHNRKGMFENIEIVRNTKSFLSRHGYDSLGQDPLPDTADLPSWDSLRAYVCGVMCSQGLQPGRKWFYKGAKICLLWPLWRDAFPGAKWIIVRRKKEEIVASCSRTSFMTRCDNWQAWVDHHLRLFDEMRNAGLDVVEVWPSKMVDGDYGEMHEVVSYLGLYWDEDDVRRFVSPELFHRV